MIKQKSKNFSWFDLSIGMVLSMIYYWIMTKPNTPFNIDYFSNIFLFVTTIVVSFSFNYFLSSPLLKKYKCKLNIFFFVLITLIIGFMLVGQPLFLMQNTIDVNIKNLIYYLLVCILIVPYEIIFIFFLEYFSNIKSNELPNKKAIKKVKMLVFFAVFFVAIIALFGFYPGNMTSDSVDQWLQAKGLRNINIAHPPLMAIVIKIVTSVIDTPFIIGLLQIVFFSSVVSSFLSYLYANGLNKRYVIIFTTIFSLLPSNVMLLTTIWKDVVYTTALLWLTYLFLKIIVDKTKFYSKWYNVVELIISFVVLYFYRHNGIGPLIFGLIFLIFYALKHNSKINYYIVITTIVLIMLINGPFFSFFDVKKQSLSEKNTIFINLLTRSSGLAIQSVERLPDYTSSVVYRYASHDLLKEYYNPFSADSYSFNEDIIKYQNEYKGDKKITTSQFLVAYIEIVKEYPTMVIKERLDGTNILWSIMHPSNGFNSRYAVGIWFPNQMTNEEWEIIKKFNSNIDTKKPGITYTNNIANVYKKAASISEKYIVLDLFIWRAGIYLALLLLWLFYILNNNKKLIWILIPLLGNTATWIVFLAYQTFRYMWYFQVIVFFILLTTFVFGKKVKDGDEIGYEKNEKNR